MTDVSGVVWRTTGPWGTGLPSNLTAEQGDNNLYLLQQAIEALVASPPTAVSIVSVSSSGNQLTFNMSDSSTIGPIYLPVLSFAWRGIWNPGTLYNQLDVFYVNESGLYLAIQTGVSGATFDPAYELSGSPAYQLLFGIGQIFSPFVGDTGSGGTQGLVPAPPPGSAAAGDVLKADGTWGAVVSGGTSSSSAGVMPLVTGDLPPVLIGDNLGQLIGVPL